MPVVTSMFGLGAKKPRFQIHSDLHLETPLARPTYEYFSQSFNFPIYAPNLFLLGDIGLVRQPQLFEFLRTLLHQREDLKIFYVLGNYEAFGLHINVAIEKLLAFEEEINAAKGKQQRFFFLNRRRIDLSSTLTILGCTLWTHVAAHAASTVAITLSDFDQRTGIHERSITAHNADHARDLAWLNASIGGIELHEPRREIIVLTHHSPTVDSRAYQARYGRRGVDSGFCMDLSGELCWRSDRVRMWAFGHTQFSCQFVEGEEAGVRKGKLVVANQKGFVRTGGRKGWVVEPVVVEAGEWKVVVGERVEKEWRGFAGESSLSWDRKRGGVETTIEEVMEEAEQGK